MKKGLSVAAFATDFGPVVYSGANLDELDRIFEKVASLGFNGVDLFLDNKTPAEITSIKERLDSHHLEVAMAIFIYLSQLGVNLSAKDKAARKTAVETYIREMDKAVLLGAKCMPIGYIRGMREDNDPIEEYCARLAGSCRPLAQAARERGIRLCLEPINRYEVNTLLSVAEAVDFINTYRLDNLYLLPDLFHMNIEDRNLSEALRLAGGRIGHLHVADSNRLAPGLGHIDYSAIMETLQEIGYQGYLSAESMSGGDSDGAAAQAASYLGRVLEEPCGKEGA